MIKATSITTMPLYNDENEFIGYVCFNKDDDRAWYGQGRQDTEKYYRAFSDAAGQVT